MILQRDKRITYEEGSNIGWRSSFLEALRICPENDYYAFSDQDDIWLENKIIKCISKILDYRDKPAMVHCNRLSVRENLIPLEKQSYKKGRPKDRKNGLTQEFAQGCTIIMNKSARDLVLRHNPDKNAPHDFWTGLICYYFGSVEYLDERLIMQVRYANSQSSAGEIGKGRIRRLKSFFKGESYYNPASDLLEGYYDLIDNETKLFLLDAKNCSKNFKSKIRLILDKDFKRDSLIGTISLKINVLLGRF